MATPVCLIHFSPPYIEIFDKFAIVLSPFSRSLSCTSQFHCASVGGFPFFVTIFLFIVPMFQKLPLACLYLKVIYTIRCRKSFFRFRLRRQRHPFPKWCIVVFHQDRHYIHSSIRVFFSIQFSDVNDRMSYYQYKCNEGCFFFQFNFRM